MSTIADADDDVDSVPLPLLPATNVDDDIDGVPLNPLPIATISAWLPQSLPTPPLATFVPVSVSTIAALPVLNPAKAALLAAGITPALPVNRVEQVRAAAEDKKRRQDEEAKAVYADFVASFAVDDSVQQQQPAHTAQSRPTKSPFTAFVRGGTIGGDSTVLSTALSTPAKRAEPSDVASSAHAVVEPPWKRMRGSSPPPSATEAAFPAPTPPAGRGKQRNIDLLLAELKQRQANPSPAREDAQPAMPTTTNVFIAGLPLSTTESDLADEMVRFGDIASVKLLYPRTEEELARPTMNGFVAYMLRRDAEDAMREMNGTVWRGQPLKLHWSKPVTLPSIPAATKANKRATAADNQLVIELPSDPSTRSLIDQLALQVSQHCHDYEQTILDQHAHSAHNNPSHPYSFLYSLHSPPNLYYRWRTHSLRAGHSLTRWDTRPFRMIPHGPMWLPPVDCANVRVVEEERRQAVGRVVVDDLGGMTNEEAGELQRLLAGVTMRRSSILAAMGWCMEHAAAAAFIIRSICRALLSSSADSCRRVSLLYLLSDLLYNSSAPIRNASLFRREATQPNNLHSVWTVFSPQHHAAKRQKHAMDGGSEQRGSASREDEQRQCVGRKERELVLSILRTWQTWSLFEDGAIEQWFASVRGLSVVPTASIPPVPAQPLVAPGAVDVDDIDGVPLS